MFESASPQHPHLWLDLPSLMQTLDMNAPRERQAFAELEQISPLTVFGDVDAATLLNHITSLQLRIAGAYPHIEGNVLELLPQRQTCLLVTGNRSLAEKLTKDGARVCLVGAHSPAAVELMVANLEQLEYGLRGEWGHPVRYRVTATAIDPKYSRRFVEWMRQEHGEELLQVAGCLEFRVLRQDPVTVTCEYVFTNQKAMTAYFENVAPKLREKSGQIFPAPIVQFARDESTFEVIGHHRRFL